MFVISIHHSGETNFRTVVDLTNLTHYFESQGSLGVEWVDMNKLNLRTGASVLSFDPQTDRRPGLITTRFIADS